MRWLLIAGLTLVPVGCEPEPRFQGMPTSYWIGELKSRDYMARMRAAHALMHLGPGAKKAIPDLIKLLDDGEPLVRWAAATTLGEFAPDSRDAVPALKKLAAEDPAEAVRDAAQHALKRLGAKTE